MIKTFRGLLADEGQARIRLSTKKGKVGYRIVKFQIFPKELSAADQESIVKIFKVKQTSITSVVDFSDGNMLAMASWTANTNADSYSEDTNIIFDQEVFNQDIYITHEERKDVAPCNYYLELETFTQTDNQAAVSTLRDIRLNPQVGG